MELYRVKCMYGMLHNTNNMQSWLEDSGFHTVQEVDESGGFSTFLVISKDETSFSVALFTHEAKRCKIKRMIKIIYNWNSEKVLRIQATISLAPAMKSATLSGFSASSLVLIFFM